MSNNNDDFEMFCSICNKTTLMSLLDGYNSCTTCGEQFTNIIDTNPEWRFYGSEDTKSSDPTRCGMPINPLLIESSFGCKIMCNNKSSYEMRKIKRYTEWQSMPYKEKSKYDDFQIFYSKEKNWLSNFDN